MSLLLDHNVPRKYLRLLQEWGYESTVLDEHIAADADDADVIALAQELDAVLLTADLDFANILDYPPADHAGIVVMRYEATDETGITATLKQALTDLYRDDLRGALVIVEPQRYRIRKA
jgi:predicted nuclease of predicted toxin-antitoxin system